MNRHKEILSSGKTWSVFSLLLIAMIGGALLSVHVSRQERAFYLEYLLDQEELKAGKISWEYIGRNNIIGRASSKSGIAYLVAYPLYDNTIYVRYNLDDSGFVESTKILNKPNGRPYSQRLAELLHKMPKGGERGFSSLDVPIVSSIQRTDFLLAEIELSRNGGIYD